MSILLGIGIHYGSEAIERAKLEDVKTDMLSIKTRAKIIAEEYSYNEGSELLGNKIEDRQLLNTIGITDEGKDAYLWDKATLENQGLNTIEENQYIVYYDTADSNNCEVYYKEGFDGVYSLTDLQEK